MQRSTIAVESSHGTSPVPYLVNGVPPYVDQNAFCPKTISPISSSSSSCKSLGPRGLCRLTITSSTCLLLEPNRTADGLRDIENLQLIILVGSQLAGQNISGNSKARSKIPLLLKDNVVAILSYVTSKPQAVSMYLSLTHAMKAL